MQLFPKSFDINLPGHHRRWVKIGLCLAVVAYSTLVLMHALLRMPQQPSEIVAGVLVVAGLLVMRKAPRVAGALGAAAIWSELVYSILQSPEDGYRRLAFIVFPLLIVGASQLIGPRVAWMLAGITATVIPVSFFALAPDVAFWTADRQLSDLVVFEIALLGTAALLSSFFRTIEQLVDGERAIGARWKDLIENAPDGIVVVDDAGTVLSINQLAELYFDVERETVIGQRARDLPGWPAGVITSPGTPTDEVMIGKRVLELTVRLGEGGAQATSSRLYFLRDVTEKREAEARARELSLHLEHSQRMEAIGHLAGGVAHDFNNLLMAVGGGAYLLSSSADEEAREIAEDLQTAAERGEALTRQLLTFARRELSQEKLVDVGETVAQLRRLVSRVLGERVVFDVEAESECLVKMDEGQLQQVVLNLAANAGDAIAGNGTFVVSVGREGDFVRLSATDTGLGIDPAVQGQVFQPFFSTKPRGKGTGLGLSTVHGIVHKWGGTISLESTPGEGTTFAILWPHAGERPSVIAQARAQRKHPSTAAHLLYVEDDPSARRFGERLLRREGFELTVCKSGEEALVQHKSGLRPDLLLTDVIMPGMTGADLSARLRREQPELPVLLLSGYLDDVLDNWSGDVTRDLLLKPFSPEDLLERIAIKLRSVKSPDPGASGVRRALSVAPAQATGAVSAGAESEES